MNKLLIILFMSLLSSCAINRVNTNPGILAREPYKGVIFLAKPNSGLRKVAKVKYLGRGTKANILNTIPGIYSRALEYKNRAASVVNRQNLMFISNIQTRMFSKIEVVEVPYEECETTYKTEYVNKRECKWEYDYKEKTSKQKCKNVTTNERVPQKECVTKYRKEKRQILFQECTAEVYK